MKTKVEGVHGRQIITNNHSSEDINSLRTFCWDDSFEAFGTAYIFKQKAHRLLLGMRILQFLGLAVPVSIGVIFLSFTPNESFHGPIFVFSGIIGFLQLIGTVWGLISQWEANYAYAIESATDNFRISRNFTSIAKNQFMDEIELKAQYILLQKENEFRSSADNKQTISESELRRGMRYALREFERKCVKCEKVPYSMKSTDCPVCGQF